MADPAPPGFWDGVDVAGSRFQVVAVGGRLDPGFVLEAYRHGCFPWPSADEAETRRLRRSFARHLGRSIIDLGGAGWEIPWVSPEPRGIVIPDQVVVPRSLRSRLRRCGWTTTMDVDFAAVVEGCARTRESTWITPEMAAAYTTLHEQGHAHSLEVWEGDELVGGLYGVAVGASFCGESMFHLRTDASKVALVDLASRMLDGGGMLIDTQTESEHLAGLGQLLMRRTDFLTVLAQLRDRTMTLPSDRRSVSRLSAADR